MTYKVIVYQSDSFAPYVLRIQRPFAELKKYGVEVDAFPMLPYTYGSLGADLPALIKQMSRYDLVIVQRVVDINLLEMIKAAAFIAQLPLVFETDDDYMHLEPHNPCYYSTALGNPLIDKARELRNAGNFEELNKLLPLLEPIRLAGLEGYKKGLSFFDAITCTTNELASTLRVYNKNVHVFPNMLERVFWERDYPVEDSNEDGTLKKAPYKFGLEEIPAFWADRDPKNKFQLVLDKAGKPTLHRVYRIGYSGTMSHYDDWNTINEGWNKVVKKFAPQCHFVYMGDPYFFHQQRHFTGPKTDKNPEGDGNTGRRQWIPETTMDAYTFNLRNLDCGVCPLSPTIFNDSKSDLKAMEYASWGAVPIVPAIDTYLRFWEPGKTCIAYSTNEGLYQGIEWLLKNPAQMEQIGRNARQYVYENRLQKYDTERRYNFYLDLINSKRKFKPLVPNKEKLVV